MSPPRRRRRRRGRGTQREAAQPARAGESQSKAQTDHGGEQAQRSRSGSRRGRGAGQRRPASPFSSEDLVRALPKERPASLTAPPDGQTLEALIGDLQSEWGVPQYPQEYRITLRVADERDTRPERVVEPQRAPEGDAPASGAPRREKAPAAPRVRVGDGVEREPAPKRRRGRRRRRRGKEVAGSSNPPVESPPRAADPTGDVWGSTAGEE